MVATDMTMIWNAILTMAIGGFLWWIRSTSAAISKVKDDKTSTRTSSRITSKVDPLKKFTKPGKVKTDDDKRAKQIANMARQRRSVEDTIRIQKERARKIKKAREEAAAAAGAAGGAETKKQDNKNKKKGSFILSVGGAKKGGPVYKRKGGGSLLVAAQYDS